MPVIHLISGSTRESSTNLAVLQAATDIDPAIATTTLETRLASLPQFNPDQEQHSLPANVAQLRDDITRADAVLISTPEYAGTMPGALKNLLEWTIGGASLYQKPVGLINCSPRQNGAIGAYAHLRIVLGYAGARIVPLADVLIPVAQPDVDARGHITNPATVAAIHHVVARLADATSAR